MFKLLKKSQLLPLRIYYHWKPNQLLKSYFASNNKGIIKEENINVKNNTKKKKYVDKTSERNNAKYNTSIKNELKNQRINKNAVKEERFFNYVLYLLDNNLNKEQKESYIEEFKQEVQNKFLNEKDLIDSTDKSILNFVHKKEKIQLIDLYSILFLCYREKITNLDFLQKLSKKLDTYYTENEHEVISQKSIIYFIQMFYFFSHLNINNETSNKKIKQYILNNDEINPLLIYKYLECLYLINDEHNNITPIVEIVIDNFTMFNNYFLIHILHFLYHIKYIDKHIFYLFTKKINETVYTSKANYFDLSMLAGIYALYKKENITFFNYVYQDMIRSITKHEDTFHNDEKEETSKLYNVIQQNEWFSNSKKNIENDSYVNEIENVNRKNYIFYQNSAYKEALNFYSFFLKEKTTNENKFKKKQMINIDLVETEEKQSKMDKSNTKRISHQSKWNQIFFSNKEKKESLKNETFVKLNDIEKEEDQIALTHDWMKKNLFYEFDYSQIVDIFNDIGMNLDKIKDFNLKKNLKNVENIEKQTIIEKENILAFKKKLMFIDSYYIGHIFYIIDSMLQLKIHINCEYFELLQKRVLQLIKNNEQYIINNFDGTEIKNVLLFLVYTNRNYKINFLYALTHKIVDLYINNLCSVKTLSVYLYNLLPFMKQKIVKKNKFNHTIKNVIYNMEHWEWLNNNKISFISSLPLESRNKNFNQSSIEDYSNEIKIDNHLNNNSLSIMRVKNYSILQLLALHICKNVYFIKLPILTSLLRSLSYLTFSDINFYNVFIPLFFKHMSELQNTDILNITHAYNRQKIKNKYFYYLLSKQYQANHSKKEKEDNKEPKIELIG